MNKLKLHRYESYTKVEGPGIRTCIWVQGCTLKCDGCFNKATWTDNAGYWVSVDELYERIMNDISNNEERVEGVTFLGGEPFQQAESLAVLGEKLRKQNLSIMTFTGYTYETILEAKREEWDALLSVTDLLIDGPYKKELHDLSRPWIGSNNQQYRFLTERYIHLKEKISVLPNKLEIHIKPNGQVLVNGMISDIDLRELKKGLL